MRKFTAQAKSTKPLLWMRSPYVPVTAISLVGRFAGLSHRAMEKGTTAHPGSIFRPVSRDSLYGAEYLATRVKKAKKKQ